PLSCEPTSLWARASGRQLRPSHTKSQLPSISPRQNLTEIGYRLGRWRSPPSHRFERPTPPQSAKPHVSFVLASSSHSLRRRSMASVRTPQTTMPWPISLPPKSVLGSIL